MGILILTELLKKDVLEEITGHEKGPPIVLIVIGCVVILVAGLGCCGAVCENKCLLKSVREKLYFKNLTGKLPGHSVMKL